MLSFRRASRWLFALAVLFGAAQPLWSQEPSKPAAAHPSDEVGVACLERGPNPGPWSCVAPGTILSPGVVTPALQTICVGDSATKPTLEGIDIAPGQKARWQRHTCEENEPLDYLEQANAEYGPETEFATRWPGAFDECGEFSFDLSASGKATESGCADVGPVPAGSALVRVTAVEELLVEGARLVSGGDIPTYFAWAGGGDIVVTAAACLDIPEDELPESWSFTGGEPIGNGKLRQKVSGSKPAVTVLTCVAGSSSASVKVIVARAEIKSISFVGPDRYDVSEGGDDWGDGEGMFGSPDCSWTAPGERSPCNPFAHRRDSPLQVEVDATIEPAGIPFRLVASARRAAMSFDSGERFSSGGKIEITASASSPAAISILEEAIVVWRLHIFDESLHYVSTDHVVYLTWGRPGGSVPTERRLRAVCLGANGASDEQDAAMRMFRVLSRGGFAYTPGAKPFGPVNIWELYLPDSKGAECPGMALFVQRHFQLLGLKGGVIRYCQAQPNGTYQALPTPRKAPTRTIVGASGHSSSTAHASISGYETLVHRDGRGWFHNYESVLFAYQKYFALGVGVFDTPRDVVRTAFPRVEWSYEWRDSKGNILFKPCTIDPWAEAPATPSPILAPALVPTGANEGESDPHPR